MSTAIVLSIHRCESCGSRDETVERHWIFHQHRMLCDGCSGEMAAHEYRCEPELDPDR